MRISSFLPLFNCRKRDYKAEDDKYQAISTFFLTFLLIFYTELFLLTEVISQPQENLTWKREFHLSYKLLADFTCWFFCFIELNLFLNSYSELSIFRNLFLRIFTDSLFTAYIFPTNHFHPFNRHITQPVFRLSLSSQPFISALHPSLSSQPFIPVFPARFSRPSFLLIFPSRPQPHLLLCRISFNQITSFRRILAILSSSSPRITSTAILTVASTSSSAQKL